MNRKETIAGLKRNFPAAFEEITGHSLEEQHKGIVVIQYGMYGPDIYFKNANNNAFLEAAIDSPNKCMPQKKVFYSETFWWDGGKKLHSIIDGQDVLSMNVSLKAMMKLGGKLGIDVEDKGIRVMKINKYDVPCRIYETSDDKYLVVSLMNGAVVQMDKLPQKTKDLKKFLFVGSVGFFNVHATNFKRE